MMGEHLKKMVRFLVAADDAAQSAALIDIGIASRSGRETRILDWTLAACPA
jgi:hypothetical protein